MLDIKGIEKAELILALDKFFHEKIESTDKSFDELTLEDAQDHCNTFFRPVFIMPNGKTLIDLSGDQMDSRVYDHECGVGAAEQVIESLREKKPYFEVTDVCVTSQSSSVSKN